MIMAGLAGWKQADFSQNLEQAQNWLEAHLAELELSVQKPDTFIHPGQTPAEGVLDLSRAVVRRAERECVGLAQSGFGTEVPEALLSYLNLLSSLLFLLLTAQTNGQKSS